MHELGHARKSCFCGDFTSTKHQVQFLSVFCNRDWIATTFLAKDGPGGQEFVWIQHVGGL
jgi:hypothetical protein